MGEKGELVPPKITEMMRESINRPRLKEGKKKVRGGGSINPQCKERQYDFTQSKANGIRASSLTGHTFSSSQAGITD